jgi:hypothetical protein
VSTSALSLPLRRKNTPMRRARKTTRFALHCEHLESRQLLSLGQTGLAAGLLANPSVGGSQLAIPATVSNFTQSNYVLEINYGTFGGLNQIQIVILGSAPLFSPTPTSSSSGAGSSLGTTGGSSGGSGNSQTGLSFATGTTSTSAITPLNPSVTSSTNTPSAPVYVVPPPLAPLAVHLGSSTAPATAQSNSTLISNLDELPQVTHFGQTDSFESRRLFLQKLALEPQSASFIDYVEPYRTVAPVAVPDAQPAGEQAPAPDAAKVPLLPPISDPNIDAALDLTDGRVLTRTHDGDASQPDDELSHTNTSWSFSALFGVAAIATGGYHLVMRESDRLRGRWIPRWQGAERPTKRKAGSPSR